MNDDLYVFPGTDVLRNNFGIRDSKHILRVERLFVTMRTSQGLPTGDLDFQHLKALHYHLFQDVYDWAGQMRTVEMSRGEQAFMPLRYIESGMDDIHSRLTQKRYLQGLKPQDFAKEAGIIIGDINHVHPFREGNGRTQLQYLKALAAKAEHKIDLTRLNRERWIEASKLSNRGNYSLMQTCIAQALVQREGHERIDTTTTKQEQLRKLRDRNPNRDKDSRDTEIER